MIFNFSSETATIIEYASSEALDRNHKYVEIIHFVWALYHTYIPQLSIQWLEKEGVNTQLVRKHFKELDPLGQCENYDDNVRRHRAPISLPLQKIFEYASVLSNDKIIRTEDILRSMIICGNNPGSDLIDKFSDGKIKRYFSGIPDEEIINESTVINYPSIKHIENFSRFDWQSFRNLNVNQNNIQIINNKCIIDQKLNVIQNKENWKPLNRNTFENYVPYNSMKNLRCDGNISSNAGDSPNLKDTNELLKLRKQPSTQILQDPIAHISTKPQYNQDLLQSLAASRQNFTLLDSMACVVVNEDNIRPLARDNKVFFEENSQNLNTLLSEHSILLNDPSNRELIKCNDEVNILGKGWRAIIKFILQVRRDNTNSLRLSRGLQTNIPFLTGYEAYLLDQIVGELVGPNESAIKFLLTVAFQNRNISRIIVQNLARFDILWHNSTRMESNRILNFVGNFPSTENDVSTSDHASNSILRRILGEGRWFTRFATGREGLATDEENIKAQNLAAESNGFESANRNQYGTNLGREKSNEFRKHHRLPVDESIIRTFIASPNATIINNGVEHVLRCLAKHWKNTLNVHGGNFAHQRMEQLNPFEMLRFHMPSVLTQMVSLRGLSRWDKRVLAPFLKKLESIQPNHDLEPIRDIVQEFQNKIVINVCGGVESRIIPLRSLLHEIANALVTIEIEAAAVHELVSSVEIGLRLGHDLMSKVNWRVPNTKILKEAIYAVINRDINWLQKYLIKLPFDSNVIHRALLLLSPKDKRTLYELVKSGYMNIEPTKLICNRACQILKREIQREALSSTIQKLSKGENVNKFQKGQSYWININHSDRVYIYEESLNDEKLLKFRDKITNYSIKIKNGDILKGELQCKTYIPVAESISRAQKAWMTFELDHCKRFSPFAFMEFSYLRLSLRKLAVLGQIHCNELDDARLNLLQAIKDSKNLHISARELKIGETYYIYENDQYESFECNAVFDANNPKSRRLQRKHIVTVPPQSMIVIGGGPTGLLTTIHCLENVLISGGEMRLYEARDAFKKGGSTFERAQIVRLDARWISMLRYHLGTIFEDVYIPLSNETNAHVGNIVPSQGFVEITIKNLENMLHIVVAKLLSRDLLRHDTESGAKYDYTNNNLVKMGKALKKGDQLYQNIDPSGNISDNLYPWKVEKVIYNTPLKVDDLKVGEIYSIYVPSVQNLCPFQLVAQNLITKTLIFKSENESIDNIETKMTNLPSVYPLGTIDHSEIKAVNIECEIKGKNRKRFMKYLNYDDIELKEFSINIRNCHVVEAIGKPNGSKVHFRVTTEEPYGVCCLSGLKVSMNMHKFGNSRWGNGIIDDIRSLKDQNTRIVGDFTKNVNTQSIANIMYEEIVSHNWELHFKKLLIESTIISHISDERCNEFIKSLQNAVKAYSNNSLNYERKFLQTRYFETGDNSYLGMEFNREYMIWKKISIESMIQPFSMNNVDKNNNKTFEVFLRTLSHHFDRLFFHGALETMRRGDVYNPGASAKIPKFYLIDSLNDSKLSSLDIGESFRVKKEQVLRNGTLIDSTKRFEILYKKLNGKIIVRDIEGKVTEMISRLRVYRCGDLTRGPDGEKESRVSLASFPVAHYVNHRAIRVNNQEKGYVFSFVGDEQSTPHFMRYSGLTGAAINAMVMNNFIYGAVQKKRFIHRFKEYSEMTNWSNSEVITRGIGAGYGEDGFLRPGFSYESLSEYLYDKVIEHIESGQNLTTILSRDWKIKFASGLIPRGLEMNHQFIFSLRINIKNTLKELFARKLLRHLKYSNKENLMQHFSKVEKISDNRHTAEKGFFWENISKDLSSDKDILKNLKKMATIMLTIENEFEEIIHFSRIGYLEGVRISSELLNQQKSVDALIDDFAIESQGFADGLSNSAAFAAAAVAGRAVTDVGSTVLSAFTPFIAFATITNSSRYKIRNEEAQSIYFDQKFLPLLKSVYCYISPIEQKKIPWEDNPFIKDLSQKLEIFIEATKYYNASVSETICKAIDQVKTNGLDYESMKIISNDIVTILIPHTYSRYPYLKDFLTQIYHTIEEDIPLLMDNSKTIPLDDPIRYQSEYLFRRLMTLKEKLRNSLERGHIKFGWHRKRKFKNNHLSAIINYIHYIFLKPKFSKKYNSEKLLSRSLSQGKGESSWKPLALLTMQIMEDLQDLMLYAEVKGYTPINKRKIHDLEHAGLAIIENHKTSLIISSGWISGVTGLVFSLGNIAESSTVSTIGAFSFGIIGPIPALLSIYMLQKKLKLLHRLEIQIDNKTKDIGDDSAKVHIHETLLIIKKLLRKVKWITYTRICASSLAAVALPLGLAAGPTSPAVVPIILGGSAVALAIGSTVALIGVEYKDRYRLNSQFGKKICEAFKDEINDIYKEFKVPYNKYQSAQIQDKEAWEYVAHAFLHKYRFDAIFGANRLSSILHYIQNGYNHDDFIQENREIDSINPNNVITPFHRNMTNSKIFSQSA